MVEPSNNRHLHYDPEVIALCAYTALTEKTETTLKHYWQDERHFRWLDPGDPFAYPNLLADYWQRGQSFAVIEPDIVIRADVYDAFVDCPEPYCCFPYAWLTQIGPALGCTRFRSEFLAQFPAAMKKVLYQNVSWRQTDVVLMRHVLAGEYGQQPHVHLPPVEHLNPSKQLAPGADPTPVLTVPTR